MAHPIDIDMTSLRAARVPKSTRVSRIRNTEDEILGEDMRKIVQGIPGVERMSFRDIVSDDQSTAAVIIPVSVHSLQASVLDTGILTMRSHA